MPFTREKVDPEEIVKAAFGMSSEEIKAKLSKIDSVETVVNDVKGLATSQSQSLTDIQTTLKTMSTPYSKGPEPNSGGSGGGSPTIEPARWDEDAEKAFQDRSKPLVGAILDTRSMIARREAIDDINAANPDLPFHKLSADIEELTKDAPLEQKANPQYWKNVYYVAVGKRRQEIEKDKASKGGKYFTETASSSIVVSDEDKGKPEDKLTQAQLDAARKTGLSPAEYAKELSTMHRWSA